jgi:hypothetical protein
MSCSVRRLLKQVGYLEESPPEGAIHPPTSGERPSVRFLHSSRMALAIGGRNTRVNHLLNSIFYLKFQSVTFCPIHQQSQNIYV